MPPGTRVGWLRLCEQRPGTEPMSAPTVSVVVPTYNRRERLARVLAALADQDLTEPYEIIVVSDGSTDGTDDDLRGRSTDGITTVFQENAGPAAARNSGVDVARGDLVVFVDDDVVASPALLRTHLEVHRREGDRAVVIGPMLDPPDHRMTAWVAWEQEMLAKQYAAMDRGEYTATARQFYTGNASVRTEHLRALGGFNTAFRRAEDVELAFRLAEHGLSFHYERDAVGLHYAERTYEAWRGAAYAYGRNDIVFARDLGHTWMFEFMADVHAQRRHPLRVVTELCVRHPRVGAVVVSGLERIVVPSPTGRRARGVRYALSGVYGIEYGRGVADELGSIDAFRDLVQGRLS